MGRNSECLEKLGLVSIYIYIYIEFQLFLLLFSTINLEVTNLFTGWGRRMQRLRTDLCKCRD